MLQQSGTVYSISSTPCRFHAQVIPLFIKAAYLFSCPAPNKPHTYSSVLFWIIPLSTSKSSSKSACKRLYCHLPLVTQRRNNHPLLYAISMSSTCIHYCSFSHAIKYTLSPALDYKLLAGRAWRLVCIYPRT